MVRSSAMENGDSIERLLRESMEGDKEAFRKLFEHLYENLFAFTRVRVPTREDALDIVQEVFVDLWSLLRKRKFVYSSEKEFYNFLYTISRRKIARQYMFRRPTTSLDDVVELKDDNAVEVHSAKELLGAIESLSNFDQEVIRLRYFSGLNFSEIAELLKKGEGALRVRHHRAIEKLKNLLGYDKE